MLGGLFSSSSSSSKTEYNTNQNSGFSEVGGPVNSLNASNSDVRMTTITTDGGAVRNALDFAGKNSSEAFSFSEATTDRAFDFGERSLDFTQFNLANMLDFARSASNEAQDSVRENVNKFTNEFASFANRQTASEADKINDLAKWAVGGTLAYLAFNAYMRGRA